MLKPFRMIVLLIGLLALAGLACSGGGLLATETPTATATAVPTNTPEATATPEPTATPDVTANFIDYSDPQIGLLFRYPSDWSVESNFGFVSVASDPELMGADTFDRQGAAIIAAIASDESISGSLSDALRESVGNFGFSGDSSIVDGPNEITINGQEAVQAVVEANDGGVDLTLIVTLVRAEGQFVTMAGVTRRQDVENYRPVLEAIAQTIRLSEPEGPEIPSAEGTITYGQSVDSTVPTNGTSAWSFIGIEGEVVDITVDPAGDLDAIVDVLDSSGNSILDSGAVDNSFSTEEIKGLTLGSSDQFLIVVSGFGGSGGDYTLTLASGSIPSLSQPIAIGDVFDGSVAAGGYVDYLYSGTAGETITIDAVPAGNFDLVIEVYGNNNVQLASVDNSFGDEQLVFTLPSNGTYTIRISGFASTAGNYTISLSSGSGGGSDLSGEAGTTLTASDSLSANDEHFFPFTASTGATVTAVVTPIGNLDVVLEVWNDDTNTMLQQVDDSLTTEVLTFVAGETANYYFRVTGFGGAAGDYSIVLTATPDTIIELAIDDVVAGVLGDDGYIEYLFRGSAGDTIIFQVISDDNMDTVIEIYDIDDNLLQSVDDAFSGEQETLTFVVPAGVDDDTLFFLRVKDFFTTSGATYTLLVLAQ